MGVAYSSVYLQGFQPSMYASPWFLTLFASVLSLNVSFRVMDILLMEGREIVFKVGLALLEDSQQQLLQMDMEDMIKVWGVGGGRRGEEGGGRREGEERGGERRREVRRGGGEGGGRGEGKEARRGS